MNGISRQTLLFTYLRYSVRERSSQSSIGVDNETVDKLVVEADVELVVLRTNFTRRCSRVHLPCWLKNGRKIEVCGLRSAECLINFEHVSTPNHFVSGEARLRHDTAELFSNVIEEVDNLFGLAGELGTKERILGGDAHGTCVQLINVISLVSG